MKAITKTKYIKNLFLLALLLVSTTSLMAQDDEAEESKSSFDLGADIVSRYVWRGFNLGGTSPAIQPYAEFATGNFTLGAWGSYTTSSETITTGAAGVVESASAATQEFDIYAGYSVGSVSFTFTDYTFPVDGFDNNYFNMNTHVGEIMVGYEGAVTLMAAVNVYGDDDNSIYAEIGLPFAIGSTEMGLTLGAAGGSYYTSEDFAIVNLALSASKDIKITDAFSFGAGASAIFNPDTDNAYLVFSISL